MNFYAHVAVASLYTTEAKVALGAMLPDLANLIGGKPPRTHDFGILRGYDLHVASDRAFHDSRQFRLACANEARRLLAFGVRRGTALAAAHVAIELLLDDALLDDEQTQCLFQSTMMAAGSESLACLLCWSSAPLATQFESLRQRLTQSTHFRSKARPPMLMDRVSRTLCNRPRLEVRASDRASLERWTSELPARCGALWDDLIDAVLVGLDGNCWHVAPELARKLRFRRAQVDEL